MNTVSSNYEPITLFDESSTNVFFIGTSISTNIGSSSFWKIKKISKVGTVWKTEYPNGSQEFEFVWNNRLSYIYS